MDRQLDRIIKLRNRIARHEPLGPVSVVQETVEDILTLGYWISPAMAAWWRTRTAVMRTLTARP